MRNRTTRKVTRPSRVVGTRRVTPVTRIGQQEARSASKTFGYLEPGSLLLNEFIVQSTLRPHETMNPGVFRCRDSSGEPTIIKVAALEHPPKPELWSLLPQLEHPHVVRTFRTIAQDGIFYELQEYCEGGSLSQVVGNDKIDADWIIHYFIPQMNEGLKYLHAKGIIHRDIKPSNIYLCENNLHGRLVLGDFDISSVLVSDRTSRHTTRMAGTWAYTAPEGFPRFMGEGSAAARITRAADYYSLGITIIELMTGTTSLHSCGLPDLYDFYLAGEKVELPDVPTSLQLLLKGLLVRNRHERWTGPEVDRWLEGANVREDMQAVINDQRFSLAKATKPFSLGSTQAVDLKTLAAAMGQFPEEAKSLLLESEVLTQWIANQDTSVAHKVERAREQFRNLPDLALFRCMVLCDPDMPFEATGLGRIESLTEWPRFCAQKALTEKHVAVNDAELRRMEGWLQLKKNPDPGLAARIADLRSRPVNLRFEELSFLLDRKLPYSNEISAFLNLRREEADRDGGLTPNEIVEQAFGASESWDAGVPAYFRTARIRWQEGFLEAWLRQRGLQDLAMRAKTAAYAARENPDEAFDTYLRALDPWVAKPMVVITPVVSLPTKLQQGMRSVWNLTYRTEGPGFPLGAIKLDGAPDHASLDSGVIRGRNGKATLTLSPRSSLLGTQTELSYSISGDQGNFVTEGLPIRYTITFPLRDTLIKLVAGGFLGALLVGGPRLFSTIYLPHVVYYDFREAAESNPTTYLPPLAFCLLGLYLATRLWLEAFKGIRIAAMPQKKKLKVKRISWIPLSTLGSHDVSAVTLRILSIMSCLFFLIPLAGLIGHMGIAILDAVLGAWITPEAPWIPWAVAGALVGIGPALWAFPRLQRNRLPMLIAQLGLIVTVSVTAATIHAVIHVRAQNLAARHQAALRAARREQAMRTATGL